MKKIIFILFIISIISCEQSKKVDYAIFSGKITNPPNGNVFINDNLDNLISEITIPENGIFTDTIYNASGYYTFSDGSEHTTIYLENGFNLSINLDTNKFGETIKYSGNGEKENNYLAKKYLLDKNMGDYKALFALEESDLIKKNETFNNELDKSLNKITNKTFTSLEKENRKYETVLKLGNYERFHKHLTKNMDFKVSEKFPDMMENIAFKNESKFKLFKAYQQLALKSVLLKAKKLSADNKTSFQEEAIKEIRETKSQLLKNYILSNLAYQIGLSNDKSEDLYKAIIELSTDEALKNQVTKKFNSLSRLNEGHVSPKFTNYENYKGGTNSLDDFKGKFIYIDVWATWCTPCVAEIPAIKKLTAKYKNKDIVFVSISIDKQREHNKWKEMIAELEMEGVQLFADNNWNSKFVQDYGIDGIPRFILIDKAGKIISSNAPIPSDSKLITLLNKYGI